MAIHRKERPDPWAELFKLADKDKSLLRDAAQHATDDAGRIHIQTLKRQILDRTDPALRATFEAACQFTNDVACKEKLPDLPHLQTVYEMAMKDISSPSHIFKAAANDVKGGKDITLAIHTAIHAHSMRHRYH